MSRPSERAIAAAFRELIASPEHEWPAFPETFRDAVERRAAELDASGPQGAEPVAWIVEHRYDGEQFKRDVWLRREDMERERTRYFGADVTVTPLYARPPVESAPAEYARVEPVPRRFTVERHGNGWAIYLGRDRDHHGLNLGHLSECSEGLATHIEEGLNLAANVPPAVAEVTEWPDGLLDRVKAAARRIENNHAPRRIPADPTDVDLVLAEVQAYLECGQPPFWLTAAQSAQEEGK